MKIHEYQAKEILHKYGVPIPKGHPAFSVNEAVSIADKLGGKRWVVKAQIHAGGRGKGGGVRVVDSIKDVQDSAESILGMNLITHQTGSEGKTVKRLLIEEGIDIHSELYAGIVLDRAAAKFVFMVSTEGGMEIEKVASETPEKIIKEWIDPAFGLTQYQARNMAYGLNLESKSVKNAVKTFLALWDAFISTDCSLAEINPLVVTKDGEIIALDGKMNFDDNALYKHPDILAMRDINEELPSEVEASNYKLNYIKLDGNVGCMVNGAGLAMSTMDIIQLNGGEPANFLDVGGVASAETVEKGFKLILTDAAVKSILINIFGGIVRCDRVAQGVIEAISTLDVSIPIVIRLEGTNYQKAAKLLKESHLDFIIARSLQEAAVYAVKAADGDGI